MFRQVSAASIFVTSILLYVHSNLSDHIAQLAQPNHQDTPLVQNLGLICVVITILGCASPLVALVWENQLWISTIIIHFETIVTERSYSKQVDGYFAFPLDFQHVSSLFFVVGVWGFSKWSLHAIHEFLGELHSPFAIELISLLQQQQTWIQKISQFNLAKPNSALYFSWMMYMYFKTLNTKTYCNLKMLIEE